MRKASKILYLAGGIVSIVWAVAFLICGISCIVLGAIGEGYVDQIIAYISEHAPEVAEKLTPEMIAAFFGVAIGLGVVFLVETAVAAVGAVFAFKAHKEDKRWLAIINIVFGVLGVTIVPAVGAVFQLISDGKEEKKEE